EHFLLCQSCEDCIELAPEHVAGIRKLSRLPDHESRALHDRLVALIEAHQLAGKTQTQRDYIKARRQHHRRAGSRSTPIAASSERSSVTSISSASTIPPTRRERG